MVTASALSEFNNFGLFTFGPQSFAPLLSPLALSICRSLLWQIHAAASGLREPHRWTSWSIFNFNLLCGVFTIIFARWLDNCTRRRTRLLQLLAFEFTAIIARTIRFFSLFLLKCTRWLNHFYGNFFCLIFRIGQRCFRVISHVVGQIEKFYLLPTLIAESHGLYTLQLLI